MIENEKPSPPPRLEIEAWVDMTPQISPLALDEVQTLETTEIDARVLSRQGGYSPYVAVGTWDKAGYDRFIAACEEATKAMESLRVATVFMHPQTCARLRWIARVERTAPHLLRQHWPRRLKHGRRMAGK